MIYVYFKKKCTYYSHLLKEKKSLNHFLNDSYSKIIINNSLSGRGLGLFDNYKLRIYNFHMNIAIIEDQKEDLVFLVQCIETLFKKNSIIFEIDPFDHVENFNINKKYDLVFMDIIVHDKNGFELSKEIRKKFSEDDTSLVFCTTLSSYAIEGYSIGAASYILKPYTYNDFVLKISPLIIKLKARESTKISLYTVEKEYICIESNDIIFVISNGHYLTYYTNKNEYVVRQTISNLEETLKDKGFFRVSNWCVVNLKYITSVSGDTILIGKHNISLSRSKKKAFLEHFTKAYGI